MLNTLSLALVSRLVDINHTLLPSLGLIFQPFLEDFIQPFLAPPSQTLLLFDVVTF